MANSGKSRDPWNPFWRGDALEPRQETTLKVPAIALEPDMAADLAGQPDLARRLHDRIAGPFDGCRIGLLETPVRIYDLSLGGCFVNSLNDQPEGTIVVLKVDLPQDGWITVRAETVYRRPGFGFAVRFLKLDRETESCIERTINTLKDIPTGP